MPIEEYEDVKEAEGNVNISVVSRQCDAAGLGIFGAAENDGDISGDTEESEYVMNCRGNLALREGRLYLCYTEPEIEGEETCHTEISFLPDEPGCVTVTRSGGVSASFVLSEGARGISVYNTPFGPIEMCVWAKKISNTVSESGGTLSMDYTVELKGLTAQRTQITVSAELIDD